MKNRNILGYGFVFGVCATGLLMAVLGICYEPIVNKEMIDVLYKLIAGIFVLVGIGAGFVHYPFKS